MDARFRQRAVTLTGPDPRRVRTAEDLVQEFDLLRRRAAHGSRKARVSLEELGDRAGIPRSTVHVYVSGRRLPPADVLDAMVIALGATPPEQHAWAEAWFRVATAARPGVPGDGSGAGAGRPVPAQLPAEVSAFVGRRAEIARLHALLEATGRDRTGVPATVVIAAITGTAGVGKSALAVHWAHRVADRFPDGQLYLNLRGFDQCGKAMDPAEAVRWFLDALDVPPHRVPADLDAQSALYRSLLAGRRMLILLDNARDTAQVRALLPGAPGCLAVVTSRNPLAGLIATEGAHPLTLDLFPPEDARQLLIRRLSAERAGAEPEAVDEIIAGCARLPLALAVAAARAATHPHLPLRTLAGELREARDRLDTLTGDDPNSDVRAVFSWSYRSLKPAAARLFRLLGLHPGPDVTAAAAASLAALPPARTRPLLAELTDANLLTEHLPGRYAVHDLLRAYATHLAHTDEPDQQRRAATARVLDHYLHTAHAADRLLSPARDPITLATPEPGVTPERLTGHDDATDWLTAEHAVLVTAVAYATGNGWHTHAWQLAWALHDYLDRRGHWQDWVAVQRNAVTAARGLADLSAQARAHRLLAVAYGRLGRFAEAHTELQYALEVATAAGDPTAQAHAQHCIAYVLERQGRYADALDHVRQALSLHRASGHQRGQARALNDIGWHHSQLGDHHQALAVCQQALDLLQDLDDHDGQAATWDSLGLAHHHLGHHAEAIASYQHAIDLYRELGDRYLEATSLTNLGDTHHADGNHRAADDSWRQALTILTDLGHPQADQVRTKLAALPATG